MSDLNKIPNGRRISRFPNRTFNALIDGERRDRQRIRPPTHGAPPGAPSTVIVRLQWEGADDLPPGSAVALGDVLLEPADDESAPFDGLQFKCDVPTGDGDKIAVTQCPIAAGDVGYGLMKDAAWAKVNVTDAGHEYANPAADETVLQSGDAGDFSIIWKETGTGEKWAVVYLAAGASVPATFGILIEDVPAAVVTYGASSSSITPGETAAAVIPMAVDADAGTITNKLNDADAQLVVRAINPFQQTIIKAGTTTGADKPVVVVGYETNWEGDAAFVITRAEYPVTILRGLTTSAIAGGSITCDNLVLLWGRDPGIASSATTIAGIVNPAAWESDDNAYCLFIQITDGTYRAIDLDCPAVP